MRDIRRILLLTTVLMMMLGTSFSSTQIDADNLYKSDLVSVEKVSLSNQYKMKVAGDLFLPKNMKKEDKYLAIIVGRPMGAAKEQSANLYATKMTERGFVTLSTGLSFWGRNKGEPRSTVLPEVYVEDFSAAVDFLGTRPLVDRNLIGVIGICGGGSFAISAAKIGPRLKATATVGMYNMGMASHNGLKHSLTLEQRKQVVAGAAEQCYAEFLDGEAKYTDGTVHQPTERSDPIEQEFYESYRTQRREFTSDGATPMTTTHPTLSSNVKFMNFYPFKDIETISPRPMFFIAGGDTHLRGFSKDAYRLAAEPKELYIVPGARHVDLYDRVSLTPFNRLESFFKEYLKK